MEVGTYLTYNEARPDIVETYLVKTGFEALKEGIESLLVSQATVYLFRTNLVGDGGDVVCFAEVLGVEDEFNGTFYNYMNIDDLSFGQEDIHGRIDVNEVVSGEDGSLVAFLDTFHSTLGIPAFDGLLVLEPRSAVVDSHHIRAGIVYGSGFACKNLRELSLGHAGVTAVAVHLIEGGGEIDRRVVTLGGAERCLDY